MSKTAIQQELFDHQDIRYRDFQAKLIPNIAAETVIGVRTPALRAMAKRWKGTPEAEELFANLPHTYFEENQLHAFLISEEKSYEECMRLTEAFLPYVDNWATCDQLSPKAFRKNPADLLSHIKQWLVSDRTYTIRFGIGMLMSHFLDEEFDPLYPEMVAGIRSYEYYVNMMIAWYFATALAKRYEAVIPFIENGSLDTWTHNKAIQKCVESRRITPEQKMYLRSLKRKPQLDPAEQAVRIRHYEAILDQAEQLLDKGAAGGFDIDLAEKIGQLAGYYRSKEWRQDFAADEAGVLPADLKRGVLSEDGIYNVLCRYAEQRK